MEFKCPAEAVSNVKKIIKEIHSYEEPVISFLLVYNLTFAP